MPHILVIDDQTNLPQFIAMELDTEGYRVSLCEGAAGLSRIQALNPDLIILNWELRSASGCKICSQLRLAGNRIPIVVITAKGDSNYRAILEKGVQACLIKPFLMNDLLNIIETHLSCEKQIKCSCEQKSPVL